MAMTILTALLLSLTLAPTAPFPNLTPEVSIYTAAPQTRNKKSRNEPEQPLTPLFSKAIFSGYPEPNPANPSALVPLFDSFITNCYSKDWLANPQLAPPFFSLVMTCQSLESQGFSPWGRTLVGVLLLKLVRERGPRSFAPNATNLF